MRKTTSKARRGKSTVTSPKKPNTEQNGAKKRGRKPKARRSSSKQSKENDEKADEPKSTTPTQRQRTAVEEETDSAAARAAAALVELEKRRDRKKRICNIINDPSNEYNRFSHLSNQYRAFNVGVFKVLLRRENRERKPRNSTKTKRQLH